MIKSTRKINKGFEDHAIGDKYAKISNISKVYDGNVKYLY